MKEAEGKVGTDNEEKLKTGKQTKREGCGEEMGDWTSQCCNILIPAAV